jgi:hypothetical protein
MVAGPDGLAVKSDGGAIASGVITDALIRAQACVDGIKYQKGWVTMAATHQDLLDVFIGVWAFVLADIWAP